VRRIREVCVIEQHLHAISRRHESNLRFEENERVPQTESLFNRKHKWKGEWKVISAMREVRIQKNGR